jgi:carbon storage regulator
MDDYINLWCTTLIVVSRRKSYMLVLGLKLDETLTINDNIKLKVIKVKEGSLRIAIDAPKDVTILREGVQDDRDKAV